LIKSLSRPLIDVFLDLLRISLLSRFFSLFIGLRETCRFSSLPFLSFKLVDVLLLFFDVGL